MLFSNCRYWFLHRIFVRLELTCCKDSAQFAELGVKTDICNLLLFLLIFCADSLLSVFSKGHSWFQECSNITSYINAQDPLLYIALKFLTDMWAVLCKTIYQLPATLRQAPPSLHLYSEREETAQQLWWFNHLWCV